jgi:hypothetical protein
MRKYLIPSEGKFYKANLHSHTTLSDGKLTAEEMKELYKSHGYSVISFTEHGKFFNHNDMTEKDFLVLNGYEPSVTEDIPDDPAYHFKRTCHMCMIALDKERTGAVDRGDFKLEYNPESISRFMNMGREQGFFVTYNHPVWSLERYSDYINYNGMHAMEIQNYGCVVDGFFEYNEQIYDEMLTNGKRIFALATDDNHNHQGNNDSFGGFIMIKAEELEYGKITDALLGGNFYASEGPEILELYIEGDEIVGKCAPAREIRFNTATRAHAYNIAKPGEFVTECRMKLDKRDKYIRLTVTDDQGKHANSNAYFLDEIM